MIHNNNETLSATNLNHRFHYLFHVIVDQLIPMTIPFLVLIYLFQIIENVDHLPVVQPEHIERNKQINRQVA